MQNMARAAADQAADYAVRATKEYIEKLNAELAMLRERLARSETASEAERAELARVTEEREALLAERARTAHLVDAARAYADAVCALDDAIENESELYERNSFWLQKSQAVSALIEAVRLDSDGRRQ